MVCRYVTSGRDRLGATVWALTVLAVTVLALVHLGTGHFGADVLALTVLAAGLPNDIPGGQKDRIWHP